MADCLQACRLTTDLWAEAGPIYPSRNSTPLQTTEIRNLQRTSQVLALEIQRLELDVSGIFDNVSTQFASSADLTHFPRFWHCLPTSIVRLLIHPATLCYIPYAMCGKGRQVVRELFMSAFRQAPLVLQTSAAISDSSLTALNEILLESEALGVSALMRTGGEPVHLLLLRMSSAHLRLFVNINSLPRVSPRTTDEIVFSRKFGRPALPFGPLMHRPSSVWM